MIRKHIPNTLTCCNLISGCIATVFAFYGSPLWAMVMIIVGAVFDFFDGMSARLLHVPSPIGKELDSLADDITFGMAPSAILFAELQVCVFPAFLQPYQNILAGCAFIMAAFSALRLAKFNLDERQTMGFIGLATPANALFWAALILARSEQMPDQRTGGLWLLVLMLVSCYLLVSEIPMFALKFKHWGWKGNELRYTFLVVSALLLIFFQLYGFAIIIALYVIMNIIIYIKNKWSGVRS